ncbi:NAD+ kinase [Desulfacinum infernum DSM 9756]|uniref:NAD kinase n=1 Tax=Desulfacinum infernum DSM 9756 TaxID=1121391 RepID=A0A1M4WI15_9BACT|nr:NAD(+)/NADH kinase [Desulfacinum infernum]SHE80810.1 NAD+ kinase [Desulfacinum infernum DSM 9756]
MNHIILIYKRGRGDAAELAQRLVLWLNRKGIQVTAQQNVADMGVSDKPLSALPQVPADAVVVLGGDGTFLSVARQLENRPLPILGVNLGGLGFLTEISRERCFEDLEQVLQGAYDIEERMRLTVSIRREGRTVFQQTVLNDAVINKGALARIVDLYTHIDGNYLTHYRADGLIVATPTGSTAYNLSAGGPIVYPTAQAVILTPICPFTLTNRPIILPGTVEIRVDLDDEAQDVALTCDGQVGCHLAAHDSIHIRVSPYPLRLIKPTSTDYFEILRTKLKWGQA